MSLFASFVNMVYTFKEHHPSPFSSYMFGTIRADMCAILTLTHVHVFTCMHVHTCIEHSTHTLRLERSLAPSGACVYERPLVCMSYSRKYPLVFSVFSQVPSRVQCVFSQVPSRVQCVFFLTFFFNLASRMQRPSLTGN